MAQSSVSQLPAFCNFKVFWGILCSVTAAIISFNHLFSHMLDSFHHPLSPHAFSSLLTRDISWGRGLYTRLLYRLGDIDLETFSELLLRCCFSLIQDIYQPFSTLGNFSPGCDSFEMFLQLQFFAYLTLQQLGFFFLFPQS